MACRDRASRARRGRARAAPHSRRHFVEASGGGSRFVLWSAIRIASAVTTSRSTTPATARCSRRADAPDDRNLGPALRREQRGEARMLDQRQRLARELLAFLGGEVAALAREVAARGLGAMLRRDRRQRLQQPVHHDAARHRLPPRRAAGARDRRGLVIELRRRERASVTSSAARARRASPDGRASPVVPAPSRTATASPASTASCDSAAPCRRRRRPAPRVQCGFERSAIEIVPAAVGRLLLADRAADRPAGRRRASWRHRAGGDTRRRRRDAPSRAQSRSAACRRFLVGIQTSDRAHPGAASCAGRCSRRG